MKWGAFMLNHQKICFFDVDGTLTIECDAQKILVPESTLEALRKAHDAGVLLFANTGRPYGTVHPMIKALPLDGFVCGCGHNISIRNRTRMQTCCNQTGNVCHIY